MFSFVIYVLTLVFAFQVPPTAPLVIDASNISRLTPVQSIDFQPEIPVASGWFTLSSDGEHIAVVQQNGGLLIYSSTTGEIVEHYDSPGETVLDAKFSDDGQHLAAIYTDGLTFSAARHTLKGETERIELDTDLGYPVRVWLDDDNTALWLEVTPPDGNLMQVVRLPLPEAEDQTIITLPSAPEADLDAYVRIGRIPAPLAITSTADGLLKVWDLETGEVLHEVQLEIPPVFGRINETTATQLAWRAPASETLNLLDFATGENQEIALLGGEYIQALMVSAAGDLVLAVHIGDDAIVAAWATSTGERLDLGSYRQCGRVPDMVQLSQDGTTLVIGCAIGLEIWRVEE